MRASQRFHAHFRLPFLGLRGSLVLLKCRETGTSRESFAREPKMATVFAVRASPGKGSFSASILSERPLALRVQIPAKPVKGEANRVLLSGLESLLGCSVQLLSGQSGRRKTLAADCTAEELVRKIKSDEQG